MKTLILILCWYGGLMVVAALFHRFSHPGQAEDRKAGKRNSGVGTDRGGI